MDDTLTISHRGFMWTRAILALTGLVIIVFSAAGVVVGYLGTFSLHEHYYIFFIGASGGILMLVSYALPMMHPTNKEGQRR